MTPEGQPRDAATHPGRREAGPISPPTRDAATGNDDRCNGHAQLCERHYDQVVFPATHNAHASKAVGYTVFNTNQNHTLSQQLQDGVRALLMDVYTKGGQSLLCHGPCALGYQLHSEALAQLATFLAGHPREVVSILYEDHVDGEVIANDFRDAGLDALTYSHPPDSPWPTLLEMIEANTRLVVMLEQGEGPPTWLHHLWSLASDTPYKFREASEFNCELNRGQPDNSLFLVNHWVHNDLQIPDENGSRRVNSASILGPRLVDCQQARGRTANFVAVDFYEHGDLFRVVEELNGL